MEEILKHLAEYAQLHNVPIIDNPTRQKIEGILQDIKPTYCLEIGSAIGYSTLCIAKKIHARDGKLISWEVSYPSYMKALYTYYSTWLSNIVLNYGDFIKFPLDSLTHEIDFLFIDAEKSFYLEYYLKCKPYLASWATVIFDDIIKYKKKSLQLITYLDTQHIKYKIIQLTNDDGILVLTPTPLQ